LYSVTFPTAGDAVLKEIQKHNGIMDIDASGAHLTETKYHPKAQKMKIYQWMQKNLYTKDAVVPHITRLFHSDNTGNTNLGITEDITTKVIVINLKTGVGPTC
jgi:hypothetical protein